MRVTPYWQGLGEYIDIGNPSIDYLLERADAKWTVDKYPLKFSYPVTEKDPISLEARNTQVDVRVPGMYSLARSTDKRVYSIVGENYTPHVHADWFQFFLKLAQKGSATPVAVGSIKGGQFIWMIAETPYSFELPGNDKLMARLLFFVPHQLGTSVGAQLLAWREKSGVAFPLALGEKSSDKTHSFIQAFRSEEAIQKEADRLFPIVDLRMQEFSRISAAAAENRPADDEEIRLFFYRMLRLKPVDKEKPWKEHKLVRLASDATTGAPGYNTPSAKKPEGATWWGVLSALAYTIDYQSGNAPDTRVQNAWFGWTGDAKRRAIATLAERFGIKLQDLKGGAVEEREPEEEESAVVVAAPRGRTGRARKAS